LLRLHVAPFTLNLTALTSLILANNLVKQLPGLRSHGASSAVVVEVLALSVPFIIAMTLPMAVLIAVLRVFTRLPSDSALGGATGRGDGGVSVRQLMTPVLGAAACVTVVALLWNDQVLPRANHRLRTLLVDTQREPAAETSRSSYKGDRELTIAELRRGARGARQEAERASVDGQEERARAGRLRAAMYEVEIHKKWAISTACLVFAAFAASLGLLVPTRGIVFITAVTFAVFSLYYVGLIGGEELGDRLMVPPFLAMWTMNLILAIAGLAIFWRIRHRIYAKTTPPAAR
jgi:lipopolysaccharide export LptBFGC system permease protein LptF